MSELRSGVDPELEAIADNIIFSFLAKETKPSAKSDVLTSWKLRDRLSHETFTGGAPVDPANRQGVFHRSINSVNTHLNSGGQGRTTGKRVTRSED